MSFNRWFTVETLTTENKYDFPLTRKGAHFL